MLTSEQSLFANIEEKIVLLNLHADVGEEFPWVRFRMTVTQLEEHTTYDSATIYLNIQSLGGECYSTYSGEFFGEGEANIRWSTSLDEARWDGSDATRWSLGDVIVDGVNC